MTILQELLSNVETVRTVAGGKFLHDRWNTVLKVKVKTLLLQEV